MMKFLPAGLVLVLVLGVFAFGSVASASGDHDDHGDQHSDCHTGHFNRGAGGNDKHDGDCQAPTATRTVRPTHTSVPSTSTPRPPNTPLPTSTLVPTSTPVPNTPAPSSTSMPLDTPVPTATLVSDTPEAFTTPVVIIIINNVTNPSAPTNTLGPTNPPRVSEVAPPARIRLPDTGSGGYLAATEATDSRAARFFVLGSVFGFGLTLAAAAIALLAVATRGQPRSGSDDQ